MALGKEGTGESMWPRADPTQTPHWMKLLEGKYQRLHAKIQNQSGKFNFRRPLYASAYANVARRVKAVRQSQCQDNSNTSNINNNNDSGIDYLDSNTCSSTAQVCTAIANEAESVECLQGNIAKTENVRSSLTCADVCASIATTHVNSSVNVASRPFSEGRGVPSCSQSTPFTSGYVTRNPSRVPSSIALTRLSSALESNCAQRVSSASQQASEIQTALNLHLQEECNDLNRGDNCDNTDNEDNVFLFHKPRPIIEDGDEIIDEYGEEFHEEEDALKSSHEVDMEVSKARRRPRRPIKTSISRISLKTTKSCPANFLDRTALGDFDANNNRFGRGSDNDDVLDSVLPLTGRGVQEGRMRVFARMSLEARHAIDETLKEMKKDEPEEPLDPTSKHNEDRAASTSLRHGEELDDFCFRDNISNLNRKFAEDVDDDRGSMSVVSDASLVSEQSGMNEINDRLHPFTVFPNKNTNRNSASFSGKLRRRSHDVTQTSKAVSRKLPHMHSSNMSTTSTFPSPHSKLPEIGQPLPTFRENTFEITSADYDIRFHHVITCSTGDSDTPPPNIRQQAIEKCQQWLIRYTPKR